ncbi:hypothetical protein BKA58DRAFT_323113 [Alternaria rosae]|uniref:uncharacterized protein n=1 Tax=Alternaria rosae TaxID=1187941 RepID=UPI001E8D0963|nr:uncharacterized protein BKA58DRAFT_323113 [Alternaria rosae]KAH6860763.1 hypothetical protein BKA58DRAFT_323113 [Alternaria rosae]
MLRITLASTIALAALAIGRHVDRSVVTKVLGVDSSQASPRFSPPDFDALEFSPALDARAPDDFNKGVYATKALWNKYLDKGNRLMCFMEATDRGAGWLSQDNRQPPSAASRWTGDLRTELGTWGWREGEVDKSWECEFTTLGLKETFQGLNLDPRSMYEESGQPQEGANDCYYLQHYDERSKDSEDEDGEAEEIVNQKYHVGGKEYTATGAYYKFAVNHGGGMIAQNIESPSHAVIMPGSWGRPANPGELPKLKTASDVFWGYWVRDNPDVKNFRVYGAQQVINTDTNLLIARALKNVGKAQLSVWPGDVFSLGTDEFRALIGSPIGATAAHLLVAHKAELGIKRIANVVVVTDTIKPYKSKRPNDSLHMFFTMEDVPPDDVTKPGGDAAAVKRETARIGSMVISVRDNGKNMVRMHTMLA